MDERKYRNSSGSKLNCEMAHFSLAKYKQELKSLNRIVTMYLDYAEDQAERQQPMYMKDWIDRLNAFLQFNDRDILDNAGKVSKTVADKIAAQEYEKFNEHRIIQNKTDDFEKFIENSNLKK